MLPTARVTEIGGSRRADVVVALSETWGWTRTEVPTGMVWFKGYLQVAGKTLTAATAARHVHAALQADGADKAAVLHDLQGHFALVVDTTYLLAATDSIRSIPLFYARVGRTLVIDADARRLLSRMSQHDLDTDAGLAVAMGGYAIGAATLYRGLQQIEAGGMLLAEGDAVRVGRHYSYGAWRQPDQTDAVKLKTVLIDKTRSMFETLARSTEGRQIWVPLSGGLDSRLIAAGLAEVGYRNVVCFAYGRPDNFEARHSREVAEHLGYPWYFVPYSPQLVRDMTRSSLFAEHMRMADSCAALPFLQDLLAIRQLREARLVPEDAIFVNGQSGDFITGNHVPAALTVPAKGLALAERRQRILQALALKHFSLWQDLRRPENLARIHAMLQDRIAAAGIPEVDAEADHGVYEAIEQQERQSKFVVSGQRVYEFYGYDWRLPLWDRSFCDFWEGVPLACKAGQGLYREMLAETNWGGVWHPLLPSRDIVPVWARYARLAAAAVVKPLAGAARWRDVDRKVFLHLTDPLCIVNVVPWSDAVFDRRGFRHGVAFRALAYLKAHGLSQDGQRRESEVQL